MFTRPLHACRLVQECIVPAGGRDPTTGVLQPDPVKFPHGLADLASYFHSKGLKAGIYTDVAHLTCAGYEGSGPGPTNPTGHWALDALTFAQWGFDLIEADFCNTQGTNMTAYALYKAAHDAIAAATAATGRPIVFYQCNWGEQQPWDWFPEVSNLARNTGDICAPGSISFDSILYNFDHTVIHSSTPGSRPGMPGTGIGAWNDPDMLGVGMPGITDTEGRTQFSLWCILGAPLFLGTDVRNMSTYTLATIGNKEAVAINQDPLGVQGYALDAGDQPIPYYGGNMLNLTLPASSGQALPLGAVWNISSPSGGQISNAAPQAGCLTIYDCGNEAGSVVFTYGCVTNTCGNQLWSYDAGSGAIRTQVTPAPSSPLCLTGVDPSTQPFSTALLQPCDGRATQQWKYGTDGSLCLPSTVWSGPTCLWQPTPSSVNMYAKPLAPSVAPNGKQSQGLALAVLNRGDAAVQGQLIDLTQFSYGPSTPVMVRDIWQGVTQGPFAGNFTTRPIASHETLLLRIYLA